MTIRGLVFDAYGTLYAVQSVRTLAIELCGERESWSPKFGG